MLLEVKNLKTQFITKKGTVSAVNGVNFSLDKGEIMAVVGESGSGKSVTSLSIMRLLSKSSNIKISGDILFKDENLLDKTEKEMQDIRGKNISMIFQEPMTSLNPVYTIGRQISEAIIKHEGLGKKEAKEKAVQMLKLVGIPSPEKRLIVCDEAVSALDVSIQAQVLNLLDDLQKELGFTYLFIAHGLNVVKHISDRVGVMYLGKMVELADVDDLYSSPLHPYTQALLSAIPIPNPDKKRNRIILQGEVPSPINPPKGCRFHTRCSKCMDICKEKEPDVVKLENGHSVACHLYANII